MRERVDAKREIGRIKIMIKIVNIIILLQG